MKELELASVISCMDREQFPPQFIPARMCIWAPEMEEGGCFPHARCRWSGRNVNSFSMTGSPRRRGEGPLTARWPCDAMSTLWFCHEKVIWMGLGRGGRAPSGGAVALSARTRPEPFLDQVVCGLVPAAGAPPAL